VNPTPADRCRRVPSQRYDYLSKAGYQLYLFASPTLSKPYAFWLPDSQAQQAGRHRRLSCR